MRPKFNPFLPAAAAVCIALATATSASAASGTWIKTTTGGWWGTTAYWAGGIVADGDTSNANFSTLDITADMSLQLNTARTINSLTFGDTDTATAFGWTLGNNGTAANILTLAGTTPTITVNALGGTKAATISAVIGGTAGMTKAGVGTLILSGANTYTGTTTVSGGTLQMNCSAGNAINGDISLTGGYLTYGATGSANQIADTANLSISGTGGIGVKVIDTFASLTSTGNTGKVNFGSGTNLTITGAMSLTGNGTTPGTAYSLAASSAASTLTVGSLALDDSYYVIGQSGNANVATLNLNGDFTGANTSSLSTLNTANPTRGLLILSGTGATHNHNFTITSGTTTVSTIIGESAGTAASLTKTGNGKLTLSGANSYSGGTTLTQSGDSTGITVANASALGTGTVLVNGGQQYSSSIQVNDNLNVANALTLKRGASGSGRATLGLGNNSTWSGNITVDNTSGSGLACIIASGTGAATASIVSGNIGYSTLGTGNNLVLRGSYYGKVTGSVSLSTGTVQLLDATKWQFSNAANTWGTLDVNHASGIVTVGAANTLSSSGVVSSTLGGTLQLNNQAGTTAYSQTIAGLSGNVKVGLTTGTATLTLNTAADRSASGVISGAISLTKTGTATQTLSGTNTYTGATTVSAGTLLVSGALGNTAVEVKTGGKLVNNGSLGGTVTTDTTGIVTGNGSFAGAATINGTLSPGNSPGYQSFGGGLILGSASTSLFEIGGVNRSSLSLTGNSYYDAIDVTGGLTLDGTINVSWFNGFTAANGNTFNLFNVISGGINASNFDVGNDLSLPSLASGLSWDTSTFASNGTITVVPEPRAALLGGLGLLALLRRRRN